MTGAVAGVLQTFRIGPGLVAAAFAPDRAKWVRTKPAKTSGTVGNRHLFLHHRGNLFRGHDGWIGNHDQGGLDSPLPEPAGQQEKEPKLRQKASEPDLMRGDELLPEQEAEGESGDAGQAAEKEAADGAEEIFPSKRSAGSSARRTLRSPSMALRTT